MLGFRFTKKSDKDVLISMLAGVLQRNPHEFERFKRFGELNSDYVDLDAYGGSDLDLDQQQELMLAAVRLCEHYESN